MSKPTKQQMADALNAALGLHVDWTKLSDRDLREVFMKLGNRPAAAGTIVGAIAQEAGTILATEAKVRMSRRIQEILGGGGGAGQQQ